MKNKIVKIGLVLLAAIVIFGVAEKNGITSPLDDLIKTKAYVQIREDGTEYKVFSQDGEEFIRYNYQMISFTKNGKERIVEFSAGKNLRKDAYLVLHLMGEGKNGVSQIKIYEEVKLEDIPEKAKEKLMKY